MFKSVIASTGLTMIGASICVLIDRILGLKIANAHLGTSRYTKNFIITLALLPILLATA